MFCFFFVCQVILYPSLRGHPATLPRESASRSHLGRWRTPSSFLQDLLSAALISHQATLMAFLCTLGVSPRLMGYNMPRYLRGPCTGRRRRARGGRGDIGGELSLSKLETECPRKRDERKNKCSSIALPSCYVLQILTSRVRERCLRRESGRVGRSENTRRLQR